MSSHTPNNRRPNPASKSTLPRGPISGAFAARPKPSIKKKHENQGGVFHQVAMQEKQTD